MAPIEEPTDTADERSPEALNSYSDSANGSPDGSSGCNGAEKQASVHSGSRSDEQTIKDEKQPTIKIELADPNIFSLDTVDQGRDADPLELKGSTIDHAAGSLGLASRTRRCDNWREAPAQIEEFRQFVERIKEKLLKAKEVFQQICSNTVASETGGICSQDAALCTETDSFTLDQYDSLNGPVLSSTLRHSASVIECNPVSGALFLAATDARQSSSSSPHRPLRSRPPNVFHFTSSPFVSSSSGNSGFFDVVRESNKEYEKLLEETLCFVEQVFLKQRKQLETYQRGPDVGVHGTGQETGLEETDEVISLRMTETNFKNVILTLEERLQCKHFDLLRLEKENDCLRDQVERFSSDGREQQEESQGQINSLQKKLSDARGDRDRIDERLVREQLRAETLLSDLMETKRALEDNRNITSLYTNNIAEQRESLKHQKILLDQYKERISQLQSELATAKLNRKASEQELETEMKKHFNLRQKFEENSKLLRKAKQYLETIGVFLLRSAGEPADDASQGSALPLVQVAGMSSNSLDSLAKNILGTLKDNCDELEFSRAALKLTNTTKSEECVTISELHEKVREAKNQRDYQKERLTNLKHSILDSISTIKKLEPRRKNEVKSLIDLLKWVSCDWDDTDASDDERSKAIDFFKQNNNMRRELEVLLQKSLMLECLIGTPTPDESVDANNSALTSGCSFREEQESVEESSEQSSVVQANVLESLEALDSILCSTLDDLVQLKFADRARKLAHIAAENARTDELEKLKDEFEMRMQTITRDNYLRCEALRKQSEKSECELMATKEDLKKLSFQIGGTVGESAETMEFSDIMHDFEFASDSQSDDSYVKIYLAPLRLLCRNVLKTDCSGTVQLLSLLRCCSTAVQEYGNIQKELTSAKNELQVAWQQTRDLARSKQTEFVLYRNKMDETSHTLAHLARETHACTAKLRAASPWSGCLDPSTATVSQTLDPSDKFEDNLLWLSNSVASLTATVEGNIKDFSTLNEQKIEMEKAHDRLLAVVGRVNAEVKELEDERERLEDERRRLCKRLEDEQSLVQSLQERRDRWDNFIEREESSRQNLEESTRQNLEESTRQNLEESTRQNLEELAVLGTGFTEVQASAASALAGKSEQTPPSILSSQKSRDSTILGQTRSSGADSRLNSPADAGRGPPVPRHSYTSKRIATVNESTTDCTDGAAQVRQVPLPMQRPCISRVLSSLQTPSRRNTVPAPVTKIKLSESMYRQLSAAPDSSTPRPACTPPLPSTSPGVLPGQPMTTCRGCSRGVDNPRPPSLLPRRADNGECPRQPDSCAVLPLTNGWRRSIVVGCFSSIVVWYIHSKTQFL